MPTLRDVHRYGSLLAFFVFLLPIFVYPAYLFEGVGQPVFIPNGEQVHLIPRLFLLFLVALMGWRFWRIRGLFGGLLLGYIAAATISTLSAGDPGGWAFSLFGSKARMDGLVYQGLLVLLGIAAYNTLKLNTGLTNRLLWSLVAAGSFQAILVCLQRLGFDPIGYLIGGSPYGEPMGTMGHIGVAAGLFMVVVVALLHLQEQVRTSAQGALLLLLLLNAVGLGVTQNRAAVYALLLSLLLYIANSAFLEENFSQFSRNFIYLSWAHNSALRPPPYERGYTNTDTP